MWSVKGHGILRSPPEIMLMCKTELYISVSFKIESANVLLLESLHNI